MRFTRHLSLSFLFVFLACGAPRIELTVADHAGVARSGEVVVSGVPFASGTLRRDAAVHVETAGGAAVPTQTRILGAWPDGSTKWLLVQFPATVRRSGAEKYFLVDGVAGAASSRVKITDEARAVTVDTGPLRVTIAKDRFELLGAAARQGRVALRNSSIRFELADGSVHDSLRAVPESVQVEDAGPVRATVKVVGWLAGPAGEKHYRIESRLRFFAGLASVEGDHTFTVLGGERLQQIRRIAFDLVPAGDGPVTYLLPGPKGTASGRLAGEDAVALSVDAALAGRLESGSGTQALHEPFRGWAALDRPEVHLGVAVRDFRHLGPKAIEVSPGRLRIEIWSPRSGQLLRFGRGRAKTHRVLYDFSGPADGAGRLEAFDEPLIATVSPQYLCSTGALGTLSPFGVPETREYDDKVGITFESLWNVRNSDPKENGMQHFGDYFHGGYGNAQTRGDLEYDTAHAAFLQYARSGDRRFYDYAVQSNQHFIDMDVNHETGDQLFHGYGENADTHEAITTSLEWGHVFTDGPADAWVLTGDERSLEVLNGIASRVAAIASGDGYGKIRRIMAGAERQVGWPLLALCRAYEVTGDPKYLAAARKVVEYIKLYAADPAAEYRIGTWWRSWMTDGCKPFMVGALHEGLGAYYDLTGDRTLIPAVVKSLDWLIDYMWEPDPGTFIYEYNAMNRGNRQLGPELNMMIVDAFRSGYEITGDERYLAVALHAFWSRVHDMKAPQNGKYFSIDTRTSPHTAAFLWRKKLMPAALPAAPQPRRRPAVKAEGGVRPDVLLRAGFEGSLSCEGVSAGRAGERSGTVAYIAGRHGLALSVEHGGYAWLPVPATTLRAPGTIELWLRLNRKRSTASPRPEAVFEIGGGTTTANSLTLAAIYNELRVRLKDELGTLDGTAEADVSGWNPGEWHHVAVAWDDRRVRLYLDGKEQVRPDEGKRLWDSVAGLPAGSQHRIFLGWSPGNWYGDSAIDELTILGKELSPAEIAARFRQEGQ